MLVLGDLFLRGAGFGGFFCGLACRLGLEWGEFLVKSDGDGWCGVGDGAKGPLIPYHKPYSNQIGSF